MADGTVVRPLGGLSEGVTGTGTICTRRCGLPERGALPPDGGGETCLDVLPLPPPDECCVGSGDDGTYRPREAPPPPLQAKQKTCKHHRQTQQEVSTQGQDVVDWRQRTWQAGLTHAHGSSTCGCRCHVHAHRRHPACPLQ